MRALLDVNVLIALLDADHALHARATRWFDEHGPAGWASCPTTQNGCLRIMSNASYPNAFPVQAVAARLAQATRTKLHAFWPDDVSLLDGAAVDTARIHGPRQVTDVYLLALAARHGGRFVTFDGAVGLSAVRDAKAGSLLKL